MDDSIKEAVDPVGEMKTDEREAIQEMKPAKAAARRRWERCWRMSGRSVGLPLLI